MSSSERQSDESLPEEYATILKRGESEDEEEYTKTEECICSFFDKFPLTNATLEEYRKDQLKETPLFANVFTLDGEQMCVEKPSDDPDASILVTGFGIRNLASLQNALHTEENKRLYELYKSRKSIEKEPAAASSASITESTPKKEFSKRSTETETELSSVTSDTSVQKEKVLYLMGLEEEIWEEEAYPQEEDLLREMFAKHIDDKFDYAQTVTMRCAQTYLRTHRIFDFFQFIIAHLLSAGPENPITFILVLLNKILLYRSGTGHPPLLYERKHVEQLFSLMDRMGTGFIDPKQYVSGMYTLGICEYNKEPTLTSDGLVSREVFVQEALESETALFNDLIKRKWSGSKPKATSALLDTGSPVRSFISGTPLIPSNMMLRAKHFPSANIIDETEEEGQHAGEN